MHFTKIQSRRQNRANARAPFFSRPKARHTLKPHSSCAPFAHHAHQSHQNFAKNRAPFIQSSRIPHTVRAPFLQARAPRASFSLSSSRKALPVRAALLILFALLPQNLFASVWSSRDKSFSFDAPESFILKEYTETSYRFESVTLPVTFIACTYGAHRYNSAEAALCDVTQKLLFTTEVSSFTHRTLSVSCAYIVSGQNTRTPTEGWALSAELPQTGGYAVFVGFYPVTSQTDTNALSESLIISALDSICVDKAALGESGIITSFIYPKKGDSEHTLSIGGKSISVTIDKTDKEANQYVIEREFLILYHESSNGFGKDACKRFYRMVYRDAYPRLRRLSFAVQNALTMGENPITSRFLLAQTLLQWTQSFTYERNLLGSDFTSLVSLALGEGGDCDSRALLLAVMLQQMNYDSALFVSSTYSHAVLGVNVPGSGARLSVDGVSYLLGETTAHVDLGLIAKDMSDASQWMGVTFPK